MVLENQLHEERPWGSFTRFTHNEPTTVKIITVKPEEAFSLQLHHKREEFWRVLAGSGTILVGESEGPAKPGDEFFIPRETLHRATGGLGGLIFLEIAFGDFDEKDIVRLKDKYGRS